jgi:hypothetical protein
MFALMVSIDYEGSDLLGIYSTLDRAVVQAQRYIEDHGIFWGDSIEIYEMPIDADAMDTVMHRRPCWSHYRERA